MHRVGDAELIESWIRLGWSVHHHGLLSFDLCRMISSAWIGAIGAVTDSASGHSGSEDGCRRQG
jgi:hypothetical protein